MTDPRQERLQLLALACTALSGSLEHFDHPPHRVICGLADFLEADLDRHSTGCADCGNRTHDD